MFKRYIKQNGFTLAELTVSIFIIALISATFLVNYHNTNKRSQLNVIKQKVASDIRLAQSFSLGSKLYGTSIPTGGWGVYFSTAAPTSYIIFADIDGDKAYDAGEANPSSGGKIVTLPSGITIYSIDIGSPVNIVFFPPDPITYINGLSNNTVQVTLRESSNNTTATILVNFFGLIDIAN